MSPEDFHAILKARDAQVNNMTLRFTRTGTLTTTPPVWQLPRKERKYFPPAEPVIFKYTSHERVTVRGPNVTFYRQLESTAEGKNPGDLRLIPTQKWSNTDGQTREFVDDESKVKGGRTAVFTWRLSHCQLAVIMGAKSVFFEDPA